jgi:hypothetical protein
LARTKKEGFEKMIDLKRLEQVFNTLSEKLISEAKIEGADMTLPTILQSTIPFYLEVTQNNQEKTQALFEWILNALIYVLGDSNELPELSLEIKLD